MKKNKYISTIIIIVVLLFSSIGVYTSYPSVYKNAQDVTYNDYFTNFVLNHIFKYNYVIHEKLNPETQLYDRYFVIDGNETDELLNTISSYTQTFIDYENQLKEEENIKYYAVDTKTKNIISNIDESIQKINIDKDIQKQYQWYSQLIFDQNGNLSIGFSNINNEELEDYINEQLYLDAFIEEDEETTSTLSLTRPKNMIITYAIPQKIVNNSALANYINDVDESQFLKYLSPYLFLGVLITILIMIIINWKYLKDLSFYQVISKIKFEILATLWIWLIGVTGYIAFTICTLTMTNKIQNIYQEFAIEYMGPYITPFINICLWFIIFGLITILIYMIKYLFHKGLKKYLIENTCLGWLMIKVKEMIHQIMTFDFNDSTNKTVFKIVIFNFVVICIISIFFVAGPLIAFIYSIIVFYILKKKFIEIKNDYEVLLKATQQLSNGHFDYELNEDIGMFNPLKKEFSHIKDGFEKAVNEEVKSQKMKTELISNVSHDLKTPLTSIITYIDLLKNQDLATQQRNEYIQILDRNALRLKNLIDDLFEVSKANSGNVHLDLIDIDIISMIKQAELECQDQLLTKELDVRTHFSQEKIICHLDSLKTYRIFENLFINISKYALDHTRVYIDVIDNQYSVIITFKNISKDEMTFNENEIVERFVQGDKSRNTSGSGLGLAIVKSFTELQGGTFKVEIDGDLFKSIIEFKK